VNWVYHKNTSTLFITGSGEMNEYDSIYDTPWYPYNSLILSIEIGSNVTKINTDAFSECDRLRFISVDEGSLYFKSVEGVLFDAGLQTLIRYPPKKDGLVYEIPASVLSIEDGAFSRCKYLTSITIPDSVVGIGKKAFYECTDVVSLEIPASVTLIEDYAFSRCLKLSAVWYYGENDPGKLSRDVFADCPYLLFVRVTGAFTDNEMCNMNVISDSPSSSSEDSSSSFDDSSSIKNSSEQSQSSSISGDSSFISESMKNVTSSSEDLNSEQSKTSSYNPTSVDPSSGVESSSHSSLSDSNSNTEPISEESSWESFSDVSSSSDDSNSQPEEPSRVSSSSFDSEGSDSQKSSSLEADSAHSTMPQDEFIPMILDAGLNNQPGAVFSIFCLVLIALLTDLA